MTPTELNTQVVEASANLQPAPRRPIIVDVDPDEASVPIAHYLWILKKHLWQILAFVAVCVTIALVVSLRLTPIYESTATIDIDRRVPTAVLGQESAQTATNDADQFLATQISLIQSDSVLRPVVQKYNLLERSEERGRLTLEEVRQSVDSPIELEQLDVNRPSNTYLLQVSYSSSDRDLAAAVANDIAQSYLQHTYLIRYKAASSLSQFMEKQLEELRANMERSSDALARYEKELNIINPEGKTSILSARLLELNAELARAQADRVSKEAAFQAIESGSLDAAQASTHKAALDTLTESLHTAQQEFAAIRTQFGPNHPEYKRAAAEIDELEKQLTDTTTSIVARVRIEYEKAREREQMLETEFLATKSEFDDLNARSFEYQALKREADGDKELYEELLRKIKEATINASFENNAARIADPARPGREPVFPNIPLITLLVFLSSSLLAVGAAIVGDMLDDTVRDPEQVTRALGAPVIGSLPEVRPWRGQIARIAGYGNGHNGQNGASSLSTYEEAIRTLRNSILLTDFDRRLRTLLVTSASPSEGKSTIAVHLAIAHAQQHKRTLLIDGDLRRPSVHKRFNLQVTAGLSDVLVGRKKWSEVVLSPDGVADLDVIPAGSSSPRRAADFIGAGLERIMDEAIASYDLIIVDAPPLLGFPEPLQMAAAVDGVVVVTRAGQTSRRAVASVLNTLSRLRANVVGLVLNEVTHKISNSYYYYGYYHKYYSDSHSEKQPATRIT